MRSFYDGNWFYFTYECKLIFITQTVHLDSLLRGGIHELGNGLFVFAVAQENMLSSLGFFPYRVRLMHDVWCHGLGAQ